MRRLIPAFVLLTTSVLAQTPAPPQTPRQALLELLKPASAEQIDRHTPDVLLKEMQKLPPEARQQEHQSLMFLSLTIAMSPNAVQLFDTGPTLAIVQNPRDKTRMEITVESDDLRDDTDAMEFGIRVTKDGVEQPMPFLPRVLIAMKLESGVWKLSRIGGSASLQLDDPNVAALLVKAAQDRWNRQHTARTVRPATIPPVK